VHLQPQLGERAGTEELVRCVTQLNPAQTQPGASNFRRTCVYRQYHRGLPVTVVGGEPQSMSSLAERWQKLRPVNPVTLEPTTTEEALTWWEMPDWAGDFVLERHHWPCLWWIIAQLQKNRRLDTWAGSYSDAIALISSVLTLILPLVLQLLASGTSLLLEGEELRLKLFGYHWSTGKLPKLMHAAELLKVLSVLTSSVW